MRLPNCVLCRAWSTRDTEVAAEKREKKNRLLKVTVTHHGSKSINPCPNNVNSDRHVSLSLACARRNTPGMGIGMKGNGGWSNVTVSCTKVTTIKISVEVPTRLPHRFWHQT